MSFFNKTPKAYKENRHIISTKRQMAEVRVRMLLTEKQELRLDELKVYFNLDNNAKLFKHLLDIEFKK